MRFKTFTISYWIITLIWVIGVGIQTDQTAKIDALTWLAISAAVYIGAVIGNWLSGKRK